MKLSSAAIDHPRIVLVATVLLLLLAVIAGFQIPIQLTPAIHTPIVVIAVPFPGAQPTEVEEQVTRKIEDALTRLDKVDFLVSSSMRGMSITQVIFLDGVDTHEARNNVEHLVNQVRRELPLAREVQPQVTEIDFEGLPLMLVNVSAPADFDQGALKQTAEDIQDELEAIPGVANSELYGGREREIHVDVDLDLLPQYGLSLAEVRGAVQAAHAATAGGSLNSAEQDLQVRNATRFLTVEDIRQVALRQDEGRLVRVGDVADVQDTYERVKNVAELDGRQCASIIVYKESDINTLGTARSIKRRVAELAKSYPHLSLTCTRDISAEIGLMFTVLGSNAVFGALLLITVLVWTMGFRGSVLVVTAIPIATAVSLVFLYATGMAISNMVLFSFILVLGMVVDGAIIVTENIHRHIERGEDPKTAAKLGVEEVSLPVIAADLTAIAAFLPMLLVSGVMGDFMGVMPIVFSVALAGSILVDHFVIPVIAALWYSRRQPHEIQVAHDLPAAGSGASRVRPNLGRITRAYIGLLRFALSHRVVVFLFVGLAICVAGGMLWSGAIGFNFFPASDRGQFEIAFELPLGYSIEETARASEVLCEPLEDLKRSGELVHYVTAIGTAGAMSTRMDGDTTAGPEFGRIMVELQPPTQRKRHEDVIIEEVRSKIREMPGVKYSIEKIEDGPPGGAAVAVRLSGKDLDQLGRLGEALIGDMRRFEGTIDVSTSYRPDSPELIVDPSPAIVGLFGMTEGDVARAVQTAVLGDTTIQLSLEDKDVTLRVQAAPKYQRNRDELSRLMVTSPIGRKATLGELAEIRRDVGLYSVNRWEYDRAVTVQCEVVAPTLPDDVFERLREESLKRLGFRPVQEGPLGAGKQLLQVVASTSTAKAIGKERRTFMGTPNTPSEGIKAEFTGENEERDEGLFELIRAMVVGMCLIFAILVIQFNSFRQSVVVLMAVPLSFVGVVAGMYFCGFPFSLAAMIGLVALTGIVVNDAIVLVDFVNQGRLRGLPVYDAIIEAGINRSRPVMLTLITTVGDLLPLLLNLSGGGEFWQPLTAAIVFGLSFASILTLVVIPVGYSVVYDLFNRGARAAAVVG